MADLRLQLGQCGEKIRYQTVVGDLENRCILIFVDRHDHLAVLHPRQVLNSARDAHSDVQVWRDDFPV